jgi:hypothetical protein
MRTSLIALACLLVASVLGGAAALADSLFVIQDPPVDFEVVDAEPFDGIGDNGPYYTFNDALLGTEGECRSSAEFDISEFSVPSGEVISAATLEVRITEIDIAGLGVNGETPEALAVDGYAGNGVDELSDFQAGDGNTLDTVAIPDPQIGQIVRFDVMQFIDDLVAARMTYAGLTVRATTFGGVWLEEGDGYPRLTIRTAPQECPGDLNGDGYRNATDFTLFAMAYGSHLGDPNYNPAADLNGDGYVNVSDFTLFASHYGQPCA